MSGFYVDKITNSIEEASSGKSFKTEVVEINQKEIKSAEKKWLAVQLAKGI